jgi:hypothetical protein
MAAHTLALAGTQRPDTSGQLMGTAALLSATQQASKALSPKAFKPLAARLSAAASLDGIPLSRLLRQQVDAETGKDEYDIPILPRCAEWNHTRQKGDNPDPSLPMTSISNADAALTDAADAQAAYRDRVCELFTMPDSPLYCSGLRSVPVSLKLRLVRAPLSAPTSSAMLGGYRDDHMHVFISISISNFISIFLRWTPCASSSCLRGPPWASCTTCT